MSRRQEKRERAAYHDSRRYLKQHPPRLSSPLFGLRPKAEWMETVRKAIRRYPSAAHRREEALRAGGVGSGRRGRSAENVLLYNSGGVVDAVEAALGRLPPEQRRRVWAVCFGGAERRKGDRAAVSLFERYLAAYLGFGRERYDIKSA